MSELRAALEAALGPIYRIEREVRPVGNCRLFVAVGTPAAPELLVKVLPAELSLAVDARAFEREVVLLADRLGHAAIVAPRGAGRRSEERRVGKECRTRWRAETLKERHSRPTRRTQERTQIAMQLAWKHR